MDVNKEMILIMNKQLQKQNLKLLMRLTLINFLNAKGVLYTYYKQQQEKELNEHKRIWSKENLGQ